MGVTVIIPVNQPDLLDSPRPITVPVSRADRIYRTVTTGAAQPPPNKWVETQDC